jgi:hypothetical protein
VLDTVDRLTVAVAFLTSKERRLADTFDLDARCFVLPKMPLREITFDYRAFPYTPTHDPHLGQCTSWSRYPRG